MSKPIKISFPHMGDYSIPISRLFRDLFPQAEIMPAPPITQKTVELGARCSPDFVCSPFKYNLGNYIEALEKGANVLFQTGMGCRYAYYGAVQEQILRDMGYQFDFICLSRERAHPDAAYATCKRLNPDLNPAVFVHALLLAVERIRIMDKLDRLLRQRIGFEVNSGEFEKAKKSLLRAIEKADTVWELQQISKGYGEIYRNIEVDMPENPLRVGIVGELYTLMEPFSNHNLEKKLAGAGITLTRQMSVTFLLFGKRDKKSLKESGSYLNFLVGANGADSVSQCRKYAEKGYDGILHIKSFGCAPELSAQPALMTLSQDYHIPILHLSFDTQSSETGLETRLEAFIDMIQMKKRAVK